MKRLLSPWWALITLGFLAYTFLQQPAFIESIKLRYFDSLIVNQEPVQTNIVVAEIDDTALQQYGQYPFPRNLYAEIIQNIADRGASTIVFNIMMPEADRFGQDDALAETLAKNDVVVPMRPDFVLVNPPLGPKVNVVGIDNAGILAQYPGLVNNIPQVEDNAKGSGIVSVDTEIDGVVRRIPNVATVQGYDGYLFPSLALEALRVESNAKSTDIKIEPYGVTMFRVLKDFRTREFYYIPVDSEGRTWIDWAQKNETVSVSNLPDSLEGKIVIVDVTARGIANPVATATGGEFAGTVQAAMLGTMINGTNIQRPAEIALYEVLGLLAGGLLLILLSRWMLVGLGATVILIGGTIPFSIWMFSTEKILVDVTAPVITLVLIALQVYGIKFVREFLEKQAIKKQFAGYASPTVVRLLQENPALIKDGMKKEVSICFSDLRGFTPLGESFGDDVKGLTKIMNGYMDAITQPILDSDGMVIKYIGDASMHIHNAPIDDPHHPQTAIETGLKMLKAVEKFNDKITAEGRPPVGMGAGINTGLGYLGEMGSTKRHSYDVLGDAVSTAARIESKCKEYGCLLLVGENTYEATKDNFFYLKVDDLQVKGKSVGLSIYTVLDGMNNSSDRKSQQQHEEMHRLYRAQKFDDAITICKRLSRHFDAKMEGYYAMWIERCEYQKTQDLPADWDGIFIATGK
jgi:adenylate cyclase